ncbi:MAG TPA: glycosyltransferase family 2 protein [Bacteroidales bacterium]|nr:glycosyltransferase family 2 protein [Bacteroidales bacterium]
MKLSICVPVYNGADSIGKLLEVIDSTFSEMEFEVVLVNDGSRDNSSAVCQEMVNRYSYVKFIDLRRNFGEHNAVMCALNYCTGDYATIIDDDLQNPPIEILKLLDEVEKGFDVVYAKYHEKKHNVFRNFGSRVNDLFATWLIEKPKDLYLCSFKIINRDMINEIIKYKGPFPYIDGLILRATNRVSSVYVEHNRREAGKSNYTLSKLMRLWLNMFVNFSIKPMRAISIFGFAVTGLSVVMAVVWIIERLLHPDTIQGWTTIAVLILFFGGLQSAFLGLIGEYIGKNYLDVNGTPQWTVRREYGTDKK